MRYLLFVLASFALFAVFPYQSARAETREAYLERLREICAVDCKEPRYALRSARKSGRGAKEDVALILDIVEVTVWNGKYLLHGDTGSNGVDPFLGTRTPDVSRPIVRVNQIVIELDENIFFDLIDVQTPSEQKAMREHLTAAGEILVERDRRRYFTKPTLRKLRATFKDRRIVVRGTPRLEAVFFGGRRDYLRQKLFVEVYTGDHVAFLPRYDEKGEPMFDGPLEHLRKEYVSSAK